jgi:hypothetical protein
MVEKPVAKLDFYPTRGAVQEIAPQETPPPRQGPRHDARARRGTRSILPRDRSSTASRTKRGMASWAASIAIRKKKARRCN